MKILTAFFALCVAILPLTSVAAPAFEPLAAFQLGPTEPDRALLLHTDGHFYGVSRSGGANQSGTLFRLSASGEISVLAHCDDRTSGTKSALVSDGREHFWGTTFSGGSARRGAIYKVHAVTGAVSMVIEFTQDEAVNKGRYPLAALTDDGEGYFWGTTQQGGVSDVGTLFKVHAASGVLTTVAEFSHSAGFSPGAYPIGTLTADGSGYLWGTTSQGGNDYDGTIFKVHAATATVTTVAHFSGNVGVSRGSFPQAELLPDGHGFLWGTTRFGGGAGNGTVFKLNALTGELEAVVDFTGAAGIAPGSGPQSGLVKVGAGFLWGTTLEGATNNSGTVFKIDSATGIFTTVAEFPGRDGVVSGFYRGGTLVADASGKLWGVNREGGKSGNGTIYRVDPIAGTLATVVNLTGAVDARSPFYPSGELSGGANGLLWGTTNSGGSENFGTIFKVDPATGSVTIACAFTGISGSARGAYPAGSLLNDGAGFLWGTTIGGGASDVGTVYKFEISTGILTPIFDFKKANEPGGAASGQYPSCELVSDHAGYLWGTTTVGGAGQSGTVFKVDASTGAHSTVVHFAGRYGAVNGGRPTAGLCPDGAGFFWGTTAGGGTVDGGTVFKVSIATGAIETIVNFTEPGSAAVGQAPQAALVADGVGNFWGTTSGGGLNNCGTIFKVNIGTGALTTMLSFTYPIGAAPGSGPGKLVSDGAGSFWGPTEENGYPSRIFKITNSGEFINIFAFTGVSGAVPGRGARGLCRHSDGNLYGVTHSGGVNPDGSPAGGGQIFRIRLSGSLPAIEAWKLAQLGHPFAPDNGDPDQDGLTTLGEYGLLRLANVADAGAQHQPEWHEGANGQRLRLIVPRDPARNDIIIQVQGAHQLDGPWEPLATSWYGAPFAGLASIVGDAPTPGVRAVEVRDVFTTVDAPQRFLRLEVTR